MPSLSKELPDVRTTVTYFSSVFPVHMSRQLRHVGDGLHFFTGFLPVMAFVASSGRATKRKGISIKTKLCLLDDSHSGVAFKSLVARYGLSQSTASTIIKNNAKLRASATADASSGKRKWLRGAALPDIEEALYNWFVFGTFQ